MKYIGRRATTIGLGFLLSLAPLSVAMADKLEDIISANVLRCGVMLDIPPVGFRNADGEPTGFDVDTCQRIADAMNVEVSLVELSSAQRVPALVSGQVDLLVASVTPTLERALSVLFTDPYHFDKYAVATGAGGAITSFEGLEGKTVALIRGSHAEALYLKACEKWAEGCKNVSLATNADQLTTVQQGRADALVDGYGVIAGMMSSGIEGIEYCCDVPLSEQGLSMAVNRTDVGFKLWLDLFISTWMNSNEYGEQYVKYFGYEPIKAK